MRTEKRLLDRTESAQYVGVGVTTFDRYVRTGVLPTKVPGTGKWDRKAIDYYLDRASGLLPTPTPTTTKPQEPVMSNGHWLDRLDADDKFQGTEGLRQ